MGEDDELDGDVFMTRISNDESAKKETKLPELSNSRGMQGLDISAISSKSNKEIELPDDAPSRMRS